MLSVFIFILIVMIYKEEVNNVGERRKFVGVEFLIVEEELSRL